MRFDVPCVDDYAATRNSAPLEPFGRYALQEAAVPFRGFCPATPSALNASSVTTQSTSAEPRRRQSERREIPDREMSFSHLSWFAFAPTQRRLMYPVSVTISFGNSACGNTKQLERFEALSGG